MSSTQPWQVICFLCSKQSFKNIHSGQNLQITSGNNIQFLSFNLSLFLPGFLRASQLSRHLEDETDSQSLTFTHFPNETFLSFCLSQSGWNCLQRTPGECHGDENIEMKGVTAHLPVKNSAKSLMCTFLLSSSIFGLFSCISTMKTQKNAWLFRERRESGNIVQLTGQDQSLR